MAQGYVQIISHGDFKKTEKFLMWLTRGKAYRHILEKYGQKGVEALRDYTPKDTGKTANSWSYEIVESNGEIDIIWKNSNINKHVNIALILQYGHGTRNGGWVEGVDYINPALRSIFKSLADEVWEVVTKYE